MEFLLSRHLQNHHNDNDQFGFKDDARKENNRRKMMPFPSCHIMISAVGLDAKFGADVCRNGILVDDYVHGLVSSIGLAHIPESLVWAMVSP